MLQDAGCITRLSACMVPGPLQVLPRLQADDARAQRIAAAGQDFALRMLTRQPRLCYWRKVRKWSSYGMSHIQGHNSTTSLFPHMHTAIWGRHAARSAMHYMSFLTPALAIHTMQVIQRMAALQKQPPSPCSVVPLPLPPVEPQMDLGEGKCTLLVPWMLHYLKRGSEACDAMSQLQEVLRSLPPEALARAGMAQTASG